MMFYHAAEESSGGGNSGIIIVAIIAAIASVIGTVVGGYYTFRAAKRNAETTRAVAETTREVERDKLSNEQIKGWREDVVELRRQRSEDLAEFRRQAEEEQQRHSRHVEECTQKISDLTDRFDKLMVLRDEDRQEYLRERAKLEGRVDALTDWGRKAVKIMEEQGLTFPAPPPGMMPSDPNGRPADVPDIEDSVDSFSSD